jgi:hypothetical protein
MGPLLVVLLHPLCTDLPYLLQRLESRGIKHCVSIGPIEQFDEGILVRLVQLKRPEHDPAVCAPARNAVGQERGLVIQSNRLGLTAARPPPGPTPAGRVYFSRQDFPHAFIQKVACPKSSSAVRGIAHDVHRPHHVRFRDDNQRLAKSDREPLFGPSWQIQLQLVLDAPHPCMVPAMSGAPQPDHVCPDPPAGSGGSRVVSTSITGASRQTQSTTGR